MPYRNLSFALVALLSMAESGGHSAADDPPKTPASPRIRLREPELDESSGLAWSKRSPRYLWTHNDSGGKNRILAFDREGRKTGQCVLRGASARDWEDMASFQVGESPRLLIADCGDNDAKRESISLYLIDEPDPRKVSAVPAQAIRLTYPDGARNCEAVCVDPVRNQIVLIAKSHLPVAGIYTIPIPDRGASGPARDSEGIETEPGKPLSVTARRVGTVAMPLITAMDIEPSSGDLWVVTYFQALKFKCGDRRESVGAQLARNPQVYALPRWKQIEAVAVDASNRVWVTTEGKPAWLGQIDSDHPLTVSPAAE